MTTTTTQAPATTQAPTTTTPASTATTPAPTTTTKPPQSSTSPAGRSSTTTQASRQKNYAKYRYRKAFNRDEVTVEQIMAISVGTMLFLVSLTCAADFYDSKKTKEKEETTKEAAKERVKKSKTVVSPQRATQKL